MILLEKIINLTNAANYVSECMRRRGSGMFSCHLLFYVMQSMKGIRTFSDCETHMFEMFLTEFSAIFAGFMLSFIHGHMLIKATFCFWIVQYKQQMVI